MAVYSMWRHETFATIFMHPYIHTYIDLDIVYIESSQVFNCRAKLFALNFARSSARSLDNPLNFCWVQLNFTLHFMLSRCNQKFYTFALCVCVRVRWNGNLYGNWRMEYLKSRRLAAVFFAIFKLHSGKKWRRFW